MMLEHWETRDPLTVAERRESKTCKGCIWYAPLYLWGAKHPGCDLRSGPTTFRRCKHYHNPTEDRDG